jgi:adenine-specific DNA-methyltransferase
VALKLLNACQNYFGSKKAILPQIFRHVPSPAHAPVFADCFMGGGSVALYAKARGYRVLANDLADRSCIAGRALIQNSSIRLTDSDILGLFAPHPGNTGFVERTYAPGYFLQRHAQLIDNAIASAKASACPVRRDLLLLLTVHFILRWRPFGDFHQKGMIQKLLDGDTDEVNQKVISVKVGAMLRSPPLGRLRVIGAEINAGVFSNGHDNRMHQQDAAEFVAGIEADTLYADPPYLGSNSYEKVYAKLDSILAGRELELPKSRFNTGEAVAALDALFESARHIPRWVFSFGGGKLSQQDCLDLIRRHRPAEPQPVKHRYLYGDARSQDASAKEILITATKE